MDKINIVSSQAVLEVSSFSTDTRLKSSSPLVNSLVKNPLFKTAPDIDGSSFQFIHTMDLSVADTMLHESSVLVIHVSGLFGRHRLGARKFVLAFLDAAVQLLHLRGAMCWCTVLLEQSRYQTLCVSLAADDVIMTS